MKVAVNPLFFLKDGDHETGDSLLRGRSPSPPFGRGFGVRSRAWLAGSGGRGSGGAGGCAAGGCAAVAAAGGGTLALVLMRLGLIVLP